MLAAACHLLVQVEQNDYHHMSFSECIDWWHFKCFDHGHQLFENKMRSINCFDHSTSAELWPGEGQLN